MPLPDPHFALGHVMNSNLPSATAQLDDPLLKGAHARHAELVELRRDLHRHPELGFAEVRTSAVVVDQLTQLGLTPRTGVARTGVVAEITNGDGPIVALRADMDALPVEQDADHDYRSTVPGVMHACGHDAHVTALLGATRLLLEARDAGRLPQGTLRLLFQPCEETVDAEGRSGGWRMVDEGALEGVDAVAALHVGGHLPSGQIFIGPGSVMGGSQEIIVDVLGNAAHAAFPHEGIDALVLAAQAVGAVQTAVSRRIPPTEAGVITFGSILGGTAPNVICDRVRLHGTMRWFEPAVRERLETTLRGVFEGLEAQGGRADITLRPGYPPVVNDARATAAVRQALSQLFGSQAVVDQPPVLAAEDFSYLAGNAPGVFFWLGAAPADEPRMHHHPRFDIDESVLPTAAAALARAGVALLEEYR